MRKSIIVVAIAVFMCVLLAVPMGAALAGEDAIKSIEIDVLLHPDGTAEITEVWDVRGVYDGTEYYKPLGDIDDADMLDFSVQDESGREFELLPSWDTKRTREQKDGTCGILKTGDGYELCWGIGEYSDHVYTINYTLVGMVKIYGDYAGFYHRFLSDMSSAPENVDVSIAYADESLTADNARIWGYGYDGEVEISGGRLLAYTNYAMGSGEYVNLLCRFDIGLFPSAVPMDMTFEQLQDRADNAGSSEDSDSALAILGGSLAAIAATLVGVATFRSRRYKLADGSTVRVPKDIPAQGGNPPGSMEEIYSALELLRKPVPQERLMGAYIMRLQRQGSLRMAEQETGKKGRKEEALEFVQLPQGDTEARLYKLLSARASSGVLTRKQMEKQEDEIYKDLKTWAKYVEGTGQRALMAKGYADRDGNKLRFTGSGIQWAEEVLAFEKYLNVLDQADGEAEHWDDYLAYAALFGRGKQVTQGLQKADPEYFEDFSHNYGCTAHSMVYMVSMNNHFSQAAIPNSDGTGGSASSSGGGGFSGGSGGGSR